MAQATLGEVLQIIRWVCAGEACELPDRELLERYAAHKDGDAFAHLVKRHGPMVFGVSRRLLGDTHEVEDVFQATFLVLVRRIGSIRRRQSVGSWLYGVAQRLALRARHQTAARRRLEREAVPMQSPPVRDELSLQEVRAVLDEEMGLLPEKYRAPLVLCYLEGHSHEQVARELGCPRTTITKRLSRACELLRRKLERRGITLAATALTTALAEMGRAATSPAMLTIKTIKAAALVAAGKSVAGCLSSGAVALAEDAVAGMFGVKGKFVLMVLALALAVGGAGVAGQGEKTVTSQPLPAGVTRQPERLAQVHREPADVAEMQERQLRDLYGDLLPAGASTRLATLRLRHNAMIWGVAYSSDGKTLASTGSDAVVRLWDANTGAAIRQFRLTDGRPARCMTFSPNGGSIAAGGEAGVVHQWDTRTGQLLFKSKVHDEGVTGIVFSPDGGRLASAGGSIVVRDLQKDSEILSFSPPGKRRDAMQGISFSPDGKLLAASHEVNVHVWDVASGKMLLTLPKVYPRTNIFTLFRDSSTLITCEWGCIRVWEITSGKQLREFNPKGKNYVSGLALSPDRKLLALADRDRIHILSSDSGEKVKELSEYFNSHAPGNNQLAFSPDDKFLAATTTQDNAVCLWDLSTGKRHLKVSDAHTGLVETAVFSPNALQALTSDSQGTVRCWDAKTGKQLRCFEPIDDDPQIRRGETVATYSPDGKWLAAGGYDWSPKHPFSGSCRVWDAATGREIAVQRFAHRVRRLAFSPDGSVLAVDALDVDNRPFSYKVYLWPVLKGQELSPSFAKAGSPASLAFLPHGKSLVCVDSQAIRIWDIAAKGLTVEAPLPVSSVFQTASLSPDAALVALSDPLREQLFLLDTATGRTRKTLKIANTYGNVSAFSFDDRMLATCQSTIYYSDREYDPSIHLWELVTGSEIARFHAATSTVSNLAFAQDGSALISGMNDGTALIWRLGKNTGPAIFDLEEFWKQLEAADATKAYSAVWAMVSNPRQATPFLSSRLQSVAPVPKSTIEKLISHLGSDDFAARQTATKSLTKIGGQVRPALEAALQQNPTLETRRRLEQILDSFSDVPFPHTLRAIRAIMVLERIGSPDAQAVLATLAGGAPGAPEAVEAKASLERLKVRATRAR
jgi:RNA polymerase sigma factor (sigma-70 family)